MFYSAKRFPGAPNESDSHLRPTTLSSGSAHNLQSPLRRISRLPNPVPLPAVRSRARYSPSLVSRRNHFPSFLHPRLLTRLPHSRSRCLPPTQLAAPHNLTKDWYAASGCNPRSTGGKAVYALLYLVP